MCDELIKLLNHFDKAPDWHGIEDRTFAKQGLINWTHMKRNAVEMIVEAHMKVFRKSLLNDDLRFKVDEYEDGISVGLFDK